MRLVVYDDVEVESSRESAGFGCRVLHRGRQVWKWRAVDLEGIKQGSSKTEALALRVAATRLADKTHLIRYREQQMKSLERLKKVVQMLDDMIATI